MSKVCKNVITSHVYITHISAYTCVQILCRTSKASTIQELRSEHALSRPSIHRHSSIEAPTFEKQKSQIPWEAGECGGNSRLVRKGLVEGMWSVSIIPVNVNSLWNILMEIDLWRSDTLLETNISPYQGLLKMIFLFPRWDMLVPRRVFWTCCQNQCLNVSSSDSSTLTQVDVYLPDAPKLDPDQKLCLLVSRLYHIHSYTYIYISTALYIYIFTYIYIRKLYLKRERDVYMYLLCSFDFVTLKSLSITVWKENVEDVFGLTWYRWEIDSYHDHWAWNRQGLPFRSLSD